MSEPEQQDTYRVPASPATAEVKIKGSRFIARAYPARTRDEIQLRIDEIRRSDRDATHHCTAHVLGPDGDDTLFNDDGEPSGTAGRPILRQIEARALTNTLVVVTRYYGGTKLGTGGLIRAYGQAASDALDSASVRTVIRREPCMVSFDYDDTSPAMYIIQKFDVVIGETNYGEYTEMRLRVRRSQRDAFARAFEDALGGRGQLDFLSDEE
jgi:uncharacterized YigZ family protein